MPNAPNESSWTTITLVLHAGDGAIPDRLSLMMWTNETGPAIEMKYWEINEATYDCLVEAGVEESI